MEVRITTAIAAADHREALSLMAEAYSVSIGRFCAAQVGSRADADELLQDTFIEALGALPGFRGKSTVRAWLFGIARRVCIRHLRRRDRRAGLLRRWSASATPTPESDHPFERVEANLELERGLARLKPKLREAVLLRYQAGLDGPEIAETLGIRPSAARKRISLGIAALRRELVPVLMDTSDSDRHEDDNEPPDSLRERPRPRIVRS